MAALSQPSVQNLAMPQPLWHSREAPGLPQRRHRFVLPPLTRDARLRLCAVTDWKPVDIISEHALSMLCRACFWKLRQRHMPPELDMVLQSAPASPVGGSSVCNR
jgi:hypothetical protein